MPADITLVKGARDAADKFSGIELFSEEQLQTMQQATMARKALKATRDAAISALVSDITVNESLTPPQQIDAQYAAAGNIRNQVAQLAAQRAKLPVNSPEAFALDQQISTLKQSFANIANNAKDFKELQKEFIDGSWNMSGGVDPNKRKILNEIFVAEQYTVEFDERGNATYITKLGNMSQSDLSNYYLKDDEMTLKIVDYSDDALSLGSQGTLMKEGDSRYNMLKTKIRNDIQKGGEARINSLIYDDLVDGFDLGLTDLGDKEANEDAAVEAIMENLIRVNQQGYSEYKAKPGNKNQGPGNKNQEPKDTRTSSEITRSEEASLKMQKIETTLDADTWRKNIKPDGYETPSAEELSEKYKLGNNPSDEDVRKALLQDGPSMKQLKNEIDNLVSPDGGGVRINDDGRFILARQNNSGQVIRNVDITEEMINYFYGDKKALYKKIGLTMDYTEDRDYEINPSDNIL